MSKSINELREYYNAIVKLTEDQISTINVDPNDEDITDYLDHQKENFAAYQVMKRFADAAMDEIEEMDKAMKDMNEKLDILVEAYHSDLRRSCKKKDREDE